MAFREELRMRAPDPDSDDEFHDEVVTNPFFAGSMAQCLAARRRASSVRKPAAPEGSCSDPCSDHCTTLKEPSTGAVAAPRKPAGPKPTTFQRARIVTAK
jgi:hypothetical protein